MVHTLGHWHSFAELPEDIPSYAPIQLILSTANFDFLKARALESRKKNQVDQCPTDIDCVIDLDRLAFGRCNVIFKVEFSDGLAWIVRIPYEEFDERDRLSMLSEIATMRTVKENISIPLPSVFDFEASAEQPFGYPYIFMECVSGTTLPNGVAEDVPLHHRHKVAKQLANVLAELQKISFDRPGYLYCGENIDQPVETIDLDSYPDFDVPETSLEFYYKRRQERNQLVLEAKPNDKDTLTACWVLKAALAHMIVEDRISGPFPLCHVDLHCGNMLFDKDFNLVSIIDWSNAQAFPIEELANCCLEIYIAPRASDENKQRYGELRKLVLDYLEDLEEEEEGITPLSTFMKSKGERIACCAGKAIGPVRTVIWGKELAKVIYGDAVTWEQLEEVYGTIPLS